MNEADFERIAGAVLANTASADERRRFEEHLASDPAAREAWEDLRAAEMALGTAGLEPAPAGLHDAVMRALDPPRRRTSSKSGWFGALVGAFASRPVAGMGYAFAAGLAVGVLALGAFTDAWHLGRSGGPSLTATIAPAAQFVPAPALELNGTKLETALRRSDEGFDARFDLPAAPGANLVVTWDPAAQRLGAIHWLDAPAGHLEADSGSLSILADRGASFEVAFVSLLPRGGPLHVTLEQNDRRTEEVLGPPR